MTLSTDPSTLGSHDPDVRPLTEAHPRTRPTSWRTVGALAVLVAVVVGALVSSFAWAAARSAPRDLPIAVVGPRSAVDQLGGSLDASMPGAFALTTFADEKAARTAIDDREVYGAVVLGPTPRVLTASAASPVVAQLLEGLADRLGAQLALAQGVAPAAPLVAVDDVRPVSSADPRGAAFAASVFPLALGGLVLGALAHVLVRGRARRAGLVVAGAALGGLAVALVTGPWLDVLPGNVWAVAGAGALAIGAIGAGMVGVAGLVGPAGLVLVGATVMAVGNPFSGAASAPDLLPTGWSTLGQLLPPGAGATALRSVAYFDGAAAGPAIGLLVGWVVVGLGLLAIPRASRAA